MEGGSSIGFYILGIAVLIVLSALFSGGEVAIFSLTPVRWRKLVVKSSLAKTIFQLRDKYPQKLLATLLIGNNMVNIALVLLFFRLWESLSLPSVYTSVLEVVGTTVIILIFGEIVPKAISYRFAERIVRVSAPFILFSWIFLKPFVWGLVSLFTWLDKFMKEPPTPTVEIEQLIEHVLHKDLSSQEVTIIKALLRFEKKVVRTVMRDRTEMVAISASATIEEIVDTIKKYRFSRYPVYRNSIDDIMGILIARDFIIDILLKNDDYTNGDGRWHHLVKDAFFVPETTPLPRLLEMFRNNRQQMAIVVDEYGGTSGLVTLEDVLEEIVGDIVDEYDKEEPEISKLSDGRWEVKGTLSLKYLAQELGLPPDYFDELEGIETVAGLILSRCGSLPENNQKVRYKDLVFTIKTKTPRRIQKVVVEMIPAESQEKETFNEQKGN